MDSSIGFIHAVSIARKHLVSTLGARDIRTRIRQNVNSRNSPFSGRSVVGRATRKEHGEAAAKIIGIARNEDLSHVQRNNAYHDNEVLELFLDRLSNNTAATVYRKVMAADDSFDEIITTCDHCGDLCSRDECSYSEDSDELFGRCCEEYYYYSGVMQEYIRRDNAYAFYESPNAYDRGNADYVTAHFAQSNSYYEYDGDYFTMDTYYELFGDDDSEDDEEYPLDMSVRQPSGGALTGYHSDRRHYWSTENASPDKHVSIGVELELYCSQRSELVAELREAFPLWYFERDSSLSESYGFEIVTQPLGKAEWTAYADKLFPILQKHGAVGYTTPDERHYGIHLNVHRQSLSPLQEARMMMFLCAAENRGFSLAIAQRGVLYGGSQAVQAGTFGPSRQRIRMLNGLNEDGKIIGIGKYSPINFHDNLAEFRIFQSTTYQPSFMKNLEFIWAFIEWTNTRAASGSSWMHIDFVKWLGSRPAADADYPHLLAYLRKPSYMGKGFPDRIRNTWVNYLPKQTTKSLDVVSGNPDLRLAA